MGLTVAVTGPTGAVGIAAVDALEATAEIDRIVAMARRPFDSASYGWVKTEYRQGDLLDRAAVEALVREADVVVHLAYLIMGSPRQSGRVNLTGARNVFAATVAADRPTRLVYLSSAAAYGDHAGHHRPVTEDRPVRGSDEEHYPGQKAEGERLLREITTGADLEVYVLRPCLVAGPGVAALAGSLPWRRINEQLPGPVRAMATASGFKPLLPDPGNMLNLVHHDDLSSAIAAAATGRGEPGAYNLAADGAVTLSEVAAALGARPVRVPRAAAVLAAGTVARLPWRPSVAEWLHATRAPALLDTTRAKERLGWQPRYTSAETLATLPVVL